MTVLEIEPSSFGRMVLCGWFDKQRGFRNEVITEIQLNHLVLPENESPTHERSDWVRLKSGGPDMIVSGVENNRKTVLCRWKGHGRITLRRSFPMQSLNGVWLHDIRP